MVSLSFLAENIGIALPVIAYLWYEVHHGRGEEYFSQIDSVAAKVDETIIAVVALSHEIEDIDEDKVADRLNGHSPDDFRLNDDDD
jgi:hypothetical protein